MPGRMQVRSGLALVAVGMTWAFGFFVSFTTVLHNDHFDRVVHARQTARYGELPFRDFLDPGYFMTGFASAGLQRLIGDRLLGDLLLDATFIATGTVIVLILASRISGSLLAGCAAALLALFSAPRLYDFDKVLFYPLGVLLCWRYAGRPTPANLVVLAAGAVSGALFRYDTGLYVGAAALTVVAAVHWGDRAALVKRLGIRGAAIAGMALPFGLFVQVTAGVAAVADQIVTYAIREGERTRISSPPQFSFLARANLPVRVRWTPGVDDARRRELAERHTLVDESPAGAPGERTWAYLLVDASPENVRRLVSDPQVEDTHGIDRSPAAIPVESSWNPSTLAERWFGFRLAPALWTPGNAVAYVYYLLWSLPLFGAVALLSRSAPPSRVHVARILSLAVLCLALDVFILRDPVAARLGGMAGPAAVMATWLAARLWVSRRALARVLVVVLAIITVWSVSVLADWQNEFFRADRLSWARVRSHYEAAATPAGDVMPHGPWFGMVSYLRECTRPADRVYASWFVPELYFYAQRGFASGVSVTFGGHWSEPRYQKRMIGILASQEVPVVLLHRGLYADFQKTYGAFDEYLRTRYAVAGTTNFGDSSVAPDAYVVLSDKERVPSGVHPASSMPCFR